MPSQFDFVFVGSAAQFTSDSLGKMSLFNMIFDDLVLAFEIAQSTSIMINAFSAKLSNHILADGVPMREI